MLKIDRLETHDRFKEFTKKNAGISECCQDLIDKRPFGNYPFYIFAHGRTMDDHSGTRVIWQPRLSRPEPQTNSMLFKAYPGSDIIKIIWIIPKRELWEQYEPEKMTHNKMIYEFIHDFENNRIKLSQPEKDDLTDAEIDAIYREIAQEAKNMKLMEKLWLPKKI